LTETEAGAPRRRKRSAGENGSIYDAIREAILAGRYAPGERLVESRLADEFGVSRTRIRDGLARLEAERLVSPAGNRGLVVTQPSSRDMEESYALRLLLEGFAARTAASTITTGELEQLHDVHQQMLDAEEAGRGAAGHDRLELIRHVTELNTQFHRLIQQAARNSRLEQTLRGVVDVPLMFRSFYWYSDRELSEAAQDHADILQAIEASDGERADELMKRHITRGLNTLRREISRANTAASTDA
jgi:DNA-binding GntR family transcriptional regulator